MQRIKTLYIEGKSTTMQAPVVGFNPETGEARWTEFALKCAQIQNIHQNNLNQNPEGTPIKWKIESLITNNNSLFEALENGIKVHKKGLYKIEINLYQESQSIRTNVGIEFTKNGVRKGIRGASALIQTGSGHNESSASISQLMNVETGEIIGGIGMQLANAGIVETPEGKSNLIITKIV